MSALKRRSQTLRIRNYPDIAIVLLSWCRKVLGMRRYQHWGGYVEEGMANLIRDYFDAVRYQKGNIIINNLEWMNSTQRREINTCVVSNDGIHLYIGRFDSPFIEQWDLNLHKLVHSWRAHSEEVYSLDFYQSPIHITRDIIISGGRDRTARIWEAYSHKCVQYLEGHRGYISKVKFEAGSGRLVLTGSHDQSIRVWSVGDGTCLNILVGHCGKVWDMSLFSTGHMILSCANDAKLKLWDRNTQECVMTIESDIHTQSLQINQDESVVVGNLGLVRSLPDLSELYRLPEGLKGSCVSMNPLRNELIAVGCIDSSFEIKIYDLFINKCVLSWEKEFGRKHTARITDVRFTPNGRRVISVSRDGTIRMWDCSSLITD